MMQTDLVNPKTPIPASKNARSLATRERILTQARNLFAALGFENTTIRAIAASAKIHPSMVMRYYGSKEELFAIAASIDFHMPDLSLVNPQRRGEALIQHILEQWESEGTGPELKVLLRASGTHEKARQRFVEVVQRQAMPVILKVVKQDRKKERVGLILIQIAGLVVSRYLFEYGPVMAMDRRQIVRSVGAALQTYLSGSLPRKE
jgi:AcrR family transcriptional regulator